MPNTKSLFSALNDTSSFIPQSYEVCDKNQHAAYSKSLKNFTALVQKMLQALQKTTGNEVYLHMETVRLYSDEVAEKTDSALHIVWKTPNLQINIDGEIESFDTSSHHSIERLLQDYPQISEKTQQQLEELLLIGEYCQREKIPAIGHSVLAIQSETVKGQVEMPLRNKVIHSFD